MLDIIVFSPFIAALLIFILGLFNLNKELKDKISWLISTICALISFIYVILIYHSKLTGIQSSIIGVWLDYGSFTLTVEYYLDSWSISIALISTLLTLIILFYSKYYFNSLSHSSVYYSMVSIFLSGMLLLIFSNNMILIFFGWETVGICSWFLIGIYHYKGGNIGEKAIQSGQKAMLVTGTADIGFLIAIAMLSGTSLKLTELIGSNVSYIVALGIIIASFGKSAQFPLHIWISSTDSRDIDAMQGPTTVSALIHAATMVNAGIYLIARLVKFGIEPGIYHILLFIGLITAVYAGISALGTDDIKRVLAYSTISQLGFMVTALSMNNGYFAGIWHLINHALFKCLLFIIAGTLIHQYHSRKLSEIRNSLQNPVIKYGLLIGLLSLSGFPGFSGFFSKDYIVELVHEEYGNLALILVMFATFLTPVYAFRMYRILSDPGKVKQDDSNIDTIIDNNKSEKENKLPIVPKITIILLSILTLLSIGSYYYLQTYSWNAYTPKIFEFNLFSSITVIISILGVIMGYYYDRWMNLIPVLIIQLIKEGFYVDYLITEIAKIIVNIFSVLSSKLQTGSNYWNFAQLALAGGIISLVYYLSQFGGIF